MKLAIVGSGRRQKDIAAEVGIREENLSRIVNGLYCDEQTQAKIAETLGRQVDELFGDHGAQDPTAAASSDNSQRSAA